MTLNPEATEFGRCEATAKSTGERCGRAAVGPHGKCDIHGGKSKRGSESGPFKHGLFSDYLDPEDRDAVDALGEFGAVEKLDAMIDWRLARLRRAVRAMNQDSEMSFYEAVEKIIEQGSLNGKEPGLSASQMGKLAKMLDRNNSAVQMEIDLVRKLIKDRNKIAEGEDHNVNLRDLFGGGDA